MTLDPRAILRRVLRAATGPAVIYLIASVLAKAGAFLLIPLYTRKLSREEYGDYALAQTLISILPTLLSLGLFSAVSRFYFEGTDRIAARERVGGVARWLVLITLATALVLQVVIVT